MTDLRLGMKIYDNSWFLRHGLEPEQAADLLADMSVSFVITQSQFLPMADSAVESTVRPEDAERYAQIDDIGFRNALRERNIGYFACLNIGFDPVFAKQHPDLLPLDQFGRRMAQQDWYIGMSPDRAENIAHKASLLARATAALDPDGVHLGFIRWPGFWETWLPDVWRARMPEYGFDRATLERFCAASGADLPVNDPLRSAARIHERHREAWRDWKCAVTVEAIVALRAAVHGVRPGIPFAINTLPFLQTDFDNAVEEVFGQDIARLSEVVEVFEVMAYHQIMGREPEWPAAVATDIRSRAGGSRAICTLQANALYLDGMHKDRGRREVLDAVEFSAAVDRVEASPADGLCVFTLSDFLDMKDSEQGARKIERLRHFRR